MIVNEAMIYQLVSLSLEEILGLDLENYLKDDRH